MWWKRRRLRKAAQAKHAMAPRSAHRISAFNCRYWFGDNGFVDMGTCEHCPPR